MPRLHYVGPFNPRLGDGVSRSVFETMVYLNSLGCEGTIFGFTPDNPLCRDFLRYMDRKEGMEILAKGECWRDARYRGIRIRQEVLPCRHHAIVGGHPDALRRIVDRLKDTDDGYVITCDDNLGGLMACTILGLCGGHCIHSPSYISFISNHAVFSRILKNRPLFAVSRFTRDELRSQTGFDAVVWYPYIDLDNVLPRAASPQNRALGFYAAGPHKGTEIVRTLMTKIRDVTFDFIATHSYVFSRDQWSTPVAFRGEVDETEMFYSRIGLLLVPSLCMEGFSRVIVEAAAHGVPAIANAVGGIPEAMGDSGVLIPFGSEHPIDINGLADRYASAIRGLFDDEALYRRLQQKALEWANAYRDQQKENTRTVYETYIKG
jgi:glycosyltransferase involved in cell wall biosynthesis